MTHYEILESLGYIVSFTTNLVVARVCLSAHGRTKVRPFLILGVSAILAVVNLLLQQVLIKAQLTPAIYNPLWAIMNLLWIVDMLLYAIGIRGLIAHYLPGKSDHNTGS